MSAQTGPALRRLRRALGFTGPTSAKATEATDDLTAALAAVRPPVSAWVGGVGLLVLLWLMILKPF